MPSIPPTAPLLEPGYRLNRYELLCRIGQGGMATVWLARTENTRGEERLVAIKTILPGLVADESLRAMFLDEARIATALHHENVAATLEVGQVWDTPYLVMEYVEGESVEALCRSLSELGLPVPAAVVIRIASDAARGLHAAHELAGEDGRCLEIVHRDVAPPNILVDEKGHARVIDFGVAKASERFTPQTAAGVMKGRVPYMAPEHASAGMVDRRSDIWSLGAVAYFMLTGRYPFDGPTDAARLIRILGTDGPDPLPDTVAPAVRDVILRALAKDPDVRYATAADFATALEVSKLPATHAEVAQFVFETLPEQVRARRHLVEQALAAADARARARALLDVGLTGHSASYRPPPVVSVEPSPVSTTAVSPSNGSLGSVTDPDDALHLPPRPWMPWVMAGAVAAIVIAAFALGSRSARPLETPALAPPATTSVTGAAPVTTTAAATAPTVTSTGAPPAEAVDASDPDLDAATADALATPPLGARPFVAPAFTARSAPPTPPPPTPPPPTPSATTTDSSPAPAASSPPRDRLPYDSFDDPK